MNDSEYLRLALDEAEKSFNDGNVPIGAVIVNKDGQVIATGRNLIKTTLDATAHAEVIAIRNAGRNVIEKQSPDSTTLFTTLEPCFACGFFITRTNIKRIVWALSDPFKGGMRELTESHKMGGDFKNLHLVEEPFSDIKEASKKLQYQYAEKKGYIERMKAYK